MKTETKILGIILFITIALLVGGVFLLSRSSGSSQNTGSVLQIDYSKGQKIGSDSAKIKLVEFSDFQCPACLAVLPFVNKIKADYPDQVQIIYRHFPLPQHQFGREAAKIAEAAGQQGKFWEMHDKLFETQNEWSGLSDVKPFFLDLAKQLGLDENKVQQTRDDEAIQAGITDDIAEGQRLGVNATPTFFLNGRKLNLRNFSDLNTGIENELKK